MSKDYIWELPGSAVVRTLHFQCHGPWFNPWLETKIPEGNKRLHPPENCFKDHLGHYSGTNQTNSVFLVSFLCLVFIRCVHFCQHLIARHQKQCIPFTYRAASKLEQSNSDPNTLLFSSSSLNYRNDTEDRYVGKTIAWIDKGLKLTLTCPTLIKNQTK